MDKLFCDLFCIPGYQEVTVCIDKKLLKAFYEIESEASHADEPCCTITEVFEYALVSILRDAGRLPKPYV